MRIYKCILCFIGLAVSAYAISLPDSAIALFALDDMLHNRRVIQPGRLFVINGHIAQHLPQTYYYGPDGHLRFHGPNFNHHVPLRSPAKKNQILVVFGSEVGEPFLQQVQNYDKARNKTPFARLNFGAGLSRNLRLQTYYYQTDHYAMRTIKYRAKLSDSASAWFGENIPSLSLVGAHLNWSSRIFRQPVELHAHANGGWRWFYSPLSQFSLPWVGGSGQTVLDIGNNICIRYWHEQWEESADNLRGGKLLLQKGLAGWRPDFPLPYGKAHFEAHAGVLHQSHFTESRQKTDSPPIPILKKKRLTTVPWIFSGRYLHTGPGLLNGYQFQAACSSSVEFIHTLVDQSIRKKNKWGIFHGSWNFYNLTALSAEPWIEESWTIGDETHRAIGNPQNTYGSRIRIGHQTAVAPWHTRFSLSGAWETGIPFFNPAKYFKFQEVWFRSGSLQAGPHPVWSLRQAGKIGFTLSPYLQSAISYSVQTRFSKNRETLQYRDSPYFGQLYLASRFPSQIRFELYLNYLGPKEVRDAMPGKVFRVPSHPEVHLFIRQSFFRSSLNLFVHGSHLFGQEILETPHGNLYRFRLFFGLLWSGA